MENNNNKEQQVNIELPEDIATGVYSNLAIITHSPTEFVTDFIGQIQKPLLEPMGKALADRMATPPPPAPSLTPQQAEVIQQAQEKFKQSQQQQQDLVDGVELKKSPYDAMD